MSEENGLARNLAKRGEFYLHPQQQGCLMDKFKTPFVFLAVVAVLSLAACNTTAGAGRDMQSVGNAIEDTAEDAKPSNN
jgi:predicted small secreted protein